MAIKIREVEKEKGSGNAGFYSPQQVNLVARRAALALVTAGHCRSNHSTVSHWLSQGRVQHQPVLIENDN